MKTKQGFTLIEVLIAAVILFMVIAATTLVYRSALLASRKAEQEIAISGYIPNIVDQISEQLKQLDDGTQSTLRGDGNVMGIDYSWSSSLLQAKAPPSTLDSFTGKEIQHPPRYRLWQVTLDMNLSNVTRTVQFEDLTYPELP